MLYAGVCGCMCGGLIWTLLVWAELSMPDSNWVPSHRLNKATGEEKSITTKWASRNQDHCTDSGQASWLPNSSVPGLKLRFANFPAFGSAWLCQQSYVSNRTCPSSVPRPSVSHLSLYLIHGFFFKFWLLHPLDQTLGGFVFVFVNMGPYGNQNFETLLLLLHISAESFQTSPEFSSQSSSQKCVWDR